MADQEQVRVVPLGTDLLVPWRTLAKPANHIAKTAWRQPGSYLERFAQVCELSTASLQALEALWRSTDLSEVWGMGGRIGFAVRDDHRPDGLNHGRLGSE